MEPAIISQAINKTFKRNRGLRNRIKGKPVKTVEALKGIDLEIKNGELFGLLGPNGAGKTTLIKIFATLLIPDSGNAFVNGHDVLKHPAKVRENIGLTTNSERQLYWKLTIEENLKYFASLSLIPKNKIKERVRQLLELMELEKSAGLLVEKCSSGMNQKASIARALLHDPPVLLLDEPTIGLDPNFALKMRKFIKEDLSRDEGKTILLTTHYMEEADFLCDRIGFINNGQIIQIDNPKNLKKGIEEDEVIILRITGSNGRFMESISSLDGVNDVSVQNVEGYEDEKELRVYSSETDGIIQSIVNAATSERVKISALSTRKVTLEDVFLKLTGERLSE